MEKLLLFIKHHVPFLWSCVECFNSMLFSLLHGEKFKIITTKVIDAFSLSPFTFREIQQNDLVKLEALLMNQSLTRVRYFNPHKFDLNAIKKVFKNPSFVMMGTFAEDKLVGYFFLRCFWNKKCFVGRLIDEPYEGKGIGRVMNQIMYNIAWDSGFQCLSTISKNNKMVMRSHANNKTLKILKELPNEYLLVEFIKSKTK